MKIRLVQRCRGRHNVGFAGIICALQEQKATLRRREHSIRAEAAAFQVSFSYVRVTVEARPVV